MANNSSNDAEERRQSSMMPVDDLEDDLEVQDIIEDSDELSEGEDLADDIENALGNDFDFEGSFYYAKTHPGAPNPCLHVQGIGSVGLPLSEVEAKRLISQAAQAPFGKGDQTVVDTSVRNTWEIEPELVSFENPEWTGWLESTVLKTVWNSLGVAPYTSKPRCELYKLLVYERGSHTQKAGGMFATVIVVLPSAFEGGQIRVSHSGSSHTIDIASTSATETSVLAWYTDVIHEVLPITSGYRLALSYNLIHTSREMPRPSLPDMGDAISQLRRVFQKWSQGKYPTLSTPYLSYVLNHEYNEISLSTGAAALQGVDAHKVGHLIPIAEELGFVLAFGKLDYHVSGTPAYSYGGRRGRWSRYDDYEDDSGDEDAPMEDIIDSYYTLKGLVDINGNTLVRGSPGQGLRFDSGSLIPEDPFDGESPDRKDYEGYMGNHYFQWGPTIDHWYFRTVLILYRRKDEIKVMFTLGGGTSWALERLKTSRDPPSEEDKLVVQELVRTLSTVPSISHQAAVIALFEYAVKWKDADLWSKVIVRAGTVRGTNSSIMVEKVLAGLGVFPFDSVKSGIEAELKVASSLPDRLDILDKVTQRVHDDQPAKEWIQKKRSACIEAYDSASVADVPVLIQIAQSNGLSVLDESIMPKLLKKTKTYHFWISLAKSLHENKQKLTTSTSTTAPSPPTSVNLLIAKCLKAAGSQWHEAPTKFYSYSWCYNPYPEEEAGKAKIERVIEVIQLCLKTGIMGPCNALLVEVLRDNKDVPMKFKTLYTPLLSELKKLLRKEKKPLSHPPFGDVVRGLVLLYVRQVLGSKPSEASMASIRKVGCGCVYCNNLDVFIVGPATKIEYREAQIRRTHIEKRIASIPDLVTFTTVKYGSPHTLVITKREAAAQATQWKSKLREAKSFVAELGHGEDMEALMGPQGYLEVQRALGLAPETAAPTQQAPAQQAEPSTSRRTVRPGMLKACGITLAGMKRPHDAR
ncbi:2OG-Fe(II) oxygenase [Coprinopsis cinerea okayama7|uniref:2OG-Fe(II) oxygenase n=1 Tax=Coprinopsis cinerea (strain Okayama-7 / 130 / ATCC MYA-4618 / FGSC 9003) TaxID=240176 RepID=D6RQC3_COPC7|nr:2OG-Fe(II) oxygenase [Coprinopsis cinerea okayama7\|eukprot:XP_002910233.1 2OG-Fe(II) oxygenase [Coprinopsis cinerea okayama7\